MTWNRLLIELVVLATLLSASHDKLTCAEEVSAPIDAVADKPLPLEGEVFLVERRTAFVMVPREEVVAAGKPWVWYAPTLPGLPGPEERWMFERFLAAGIAVAGIDVGESFGNPDGRRLYSAMYRDMTESRGYSPKPILLGRSRGGLMTLAWAAENPEKVAGFAGIYPVCNLASYPGIERAAEAYGLAPNQLEQQLAAHNPVDRLSQLAQHRVPLFAIHGDVDQVVPLQANSGLMKTRYEQFGGTMQLIVPPDQGHNMWPGFFQCQELVEFVKKQAAPHIRVIQPVDYQVIQRQRSDRGVIQVHGVLVNHWATAREALIVEARVVSADFSSPWQLVAEKLPSTQWTASLDAPAGGWYRLEIRTRQGDVTVAEASVEHVGIGEVFVVAGQSNSANHGERRLSTRTGKVAAYTGTHWQLSSDPQPGASGDAGSFMPPLGDLLVERLGVPIGIVACGIGATSVREWLPAGSSFDHPPTLRGNVQELPGGGWESRGDIYATFAARLQQLGPHGFRAVLWHQGESDANQADANCTLPGPLYAEYLTALIQATRRDIGWQAPWVVAQVSYHSPTDMRSDDIRAAQASVAQLSNIVAGPDSDALDAPYRDGNGQGVHFNERGLKELAARWVECIEPWLQE
jgi:hypothetical protein